MESDNDNLQVENGNFTRIHNRILEELAQIQLSGHESRILFALWRETYGWQKKEQWITPQKFKELTGLGKTRISETLKRLKERNLVTENRNSNEIKYGFNKHFAIWKPLRKTVTVTENRNSCYGKLEQPLRKTVTQNAIEGGKNRHLQSPKETSKETSKETTTVQKQKINFDFNKEKWENIKNKDKEGWLEAYPSCDINTELAQMREWLISNPNKKKKNYRRFIINWLSRSQERGGTKKPYQSEEAREQAFREQKIKENKRQKEEERIRQQKIIDEVEIRLRDLDPEKRKELEVKAKGEFKKTAGVIRPEREKAFIDGWIKNWVEVGIRAKFSIEETKSRAPP